MNKYAEKLLSDDIELALKLSKFTKLFKIFMALTLVLSYFFFKAWLLEIMLISIVITLITPLGFFDVFIQKLVEYNTQVSESRQQLNATETNEHIAKLYEKIDETHQ